MDVGKLLRKIDKIQELIVLSLDYLGGSIMGYTVARVKLYNPRDESKFIVRWEYS